MSASTELVADFWRDKIRGVLLGAACGDALGVPFSGKLIVAESELTAHEQTSDPLAHTAVTEQMLAAAGYFARQRDLDQLDQLDREGLALVLAYRWRSQRDRSGYSPADTELFSGLLGLRRHAAIGGTGAGQRAPSHAAAVAAVLPLMVVHPSRVSALAESAASVTESEAADVAAVRLFAGAVGLVLTDDPFRPLDRFRFFDRLGEFAGPQVRGRLEMVRQMLDHAVPTAVSREFAVFSGSPREIVPAALIAFLGRAESPRATLRFAVRTGGHASSTAALAGALAGARCGAAALPRGCVDRLEAHAELLGVADELTGR